MPLVCPNIWHSHYGKVGAFWSITVMVGLAVSSGVLFMLSQVIHVLLSEYIPFIILASVLFTIAGGVHFSLHVHGSPLNNLIFMSVCTVLSGFIGTTGAAMLFIRPWITMNQWRKNASHSFVFFIFLVCNVGGVLTVLGDPPLFLGYLKGVDFFWPTVHCVQPFLVMAVPLLALYFMIDFYYYYKEPQEAKQQAQQHVQKQRQQKGMLVITGKSHILLFFVVMLGVLISGCWKSNVVFLCFGTVVALQDMLRDALLCTTAFLSYRLLPQQGRCQNDFSWGPLVEVAKLFIAIFITAMPVVAMLQEQEHGPFASILSLLNQPGSVPLYYWLTGLLSAFLDNAPTYLVFFHMAGGNASHLMSVLKPVLVAISTGAVFMGALTYIGNAPNFMVKTIATSKGICMPSFFGYIVWSCLCFLPFLCLVHLLCLR